MEEKWGRKRAKNLEEVRRRKREGTDLVSRDKAAQREAEVQRQRRAELAELQQERRDLDAGLGGPKSYFDQYRRRVYDPLKDSNVNNVVRETRRETSEKRKADRQKVLQGMADRMVASGRAGSVNLNPSAMDVQAAEIRQRTATAAAKAQLRDYWSNRLSSVSKRLDDANASIEDAKKRGLWGDGPIVGGVGGVMDAMWAREKHSQDMQRKDRQKKLGTGGEKPVAMGGVHFTGPDNTPFRAGSGNKRLVQEYAMAKAREANEHAMYVAQRSAKLKAEKEDRAAKGDFIHRNYAEFTKQLMLQQLANDKTWKEVAVLKAIRDAGRAGYRPEKSAATNGVPVTQEEAPPAAPQPMGFSGGNRDPNFSPGESWSSGGRVTSNSQQPTSKEAPVTYASGNYDAADIDSQVPEESGPRASGPATTEEKLDAMTPAARKYIW